MITIFLILTMIIAVVSHERGYQEGKRIANMRKDTI